MIGYLTLGTNDLAKARAFYTELLALNEARPIHETARGVFFAKAPGEPMLVVCTPYNEQPANFGNGTMVALNVASMEVVEAMYRKALELGGSCEGAPGFRVADVFYAAYVRDLDGNKLAFTFRKA
jgi:predicted lactoylglutathione lyase